MSAQLDELCDRTRSQLDVLAHRVSDLSARLAGDRSVMLVRIELEIEQARAALTRIQDDAHAARTRMREQPRRTEGVVAEWKRHRDVERLEGRARDAEAHAAWSGLVATAAIAEMVLAMVTAIAARLDVDEIADGPPLRFPASESRDRYGI